MNSSTGALVRAARVMFSNTGEQARASALAVSIALCATSSLG